MLFQNNLHCPSFLKMKDSQEEKFSRGTILKILKRKEPQEPQKERTSRVKILKQLFKQVLHRSGEYCTCRRLQNLHSLKNHEQYLQNSQRLPILYHLFMKLINQQIETMSEAGGCYSTQPQISGSIEPRGKGRPPLPIFKPS